ncbi:MAG: HD domain-containing protein [Clostridiales bacterium]|nr:HD domain-containing protein [Clostridiales bacterium]
MLTVKQAEHEIEIAEKLTPGLWVAHSRSAGDNARLIARKCGMDEDKAYVFGLLHDIGRRDGSWNSRHMIDGYNYMTSINEPEIARICLTHSFPIDKDISQYIDRITITDEQKLFLVEYLKGIEFDDYDLLIQLCDAISLPQGAVLMEKRLMDVALRHGVSDFSIKKWRDFFELKKLFDGKCGCNIYSFLPNVVENTFKDL